MLKEYKNTETF